MVAFHSKRKHLQKTEEPIKAHYDSVPAAIIKRMETMDYSETILDYNYTNLNTNSNNNNINNISSMSSNNNNNSGTSNINRSSDINIMENFNHNLFELQPFLANSNNYDNYNNINTFNGLNSTVLVDIYDTAFSPTVFLTDATTTVASVVSNNRGLLMDTLLGSVMTTATATVTSPSLSASLSNSASITSTSLSTASSASAPLASLPENFYETTVIAVNTLQSPSSASSSLTNDTSSTSSSSAYWELETADFDFLYRHSLAMTIVYCIAYVIVFLVGLVGNSFVIAVVLRMRNMRTVTNYFIVNLAIADILVIVFCLPATLMSNIFVRKYEKKFYLFFFRIFNYLQKIILRGEDTGRQEISNKNYLLNFQKIFV